MEFNEIKDMLGDLIPELNKITIEFMTRAGVSSNSNLNKSVEYVVTNKGIEMVANSYWFYSSEGRRPRTRKVPITALIDYIKRYGLRPRAGQSINQLAFAIQTSIYKQGINPKNYANKVIDATADTTEEVVADEVIQILTEETLQLMTATPYATEV